MDYLSVLGTRVILNTVIRGHPGGGTRAVACCGQGLSIRATEKSPRLVASPAVLVLLNGVRCCRRLDEDTWGDRV